MAGRNSTLSIDVPSTPAADPAQARADLKLLVEPCVRGNLMLWGCFGAVSVLCCMGMLGLAAFAPHRPDEVVAMVVCVLMGLFIGLVGGGTWAWFWIRIFLLRRFVYSRPAEIVRMHLMVVERRGMVFTALHLMTKQGRKTAVTVPDVNYGVRIARLLASLGAVAGQAPPP
jgi:hypothetical protein